MLIVGAIKRTHSQKLEVSKCPSVGGFHRVAMLMDKTKENLFTKFA